MKSVKSGKPKKSIKKQTFQKIIYDHYENNGRDLPWRKVKDPYKILVSEMMLQQTQVDRVIEKYQAFLRVFPTVTDLAKAPVPKVLSLWSGLGYNRRALFLKSTAEQIVAEFKGKFPREHEQLLKLRGIGPYTASAIRAFAFNLPGALIETNVRTVFLHFFFKGAINVSDAQLFPLITTMLDTENPRRWYSALMDYGTMLKSEIGNVNKTSKHYTKQSKFQGSERQVRGEILKFLVSYEKLATQAVILKNVKRPKEKVLKKLIELEDEGFIVKKGRSFSLAK